MTPDAPRTPLRVAPGDRVILHVGTWPIADGQSVWVRYGIESASGATDRRMVRGRWVRNAGVNSYWEVDLGQFQRGDRVTYTVLGEAEPGETQASESYSFRVGPKLELALLWHQHQPVYVDPEHGERAGSACQPWARLHALRDYYAMAALVARFPRVRLTINLTAALLRQIDLYLDGGVTDRALELTKKPVTALSAEEREQIAATFFDASWHHQILPHPRYRELFDKRSENLPLDDQDIADLQMWFSLAWFHPMFWDDDIELVTGHVVRVRRFVEQAAGFSRADIDAMIDEQYAVLRAIVPIHKQLQDAGQIEVTTSPLQHPILPLLIDTDAAIIDRPGATLPRRFAYREDASAQIAEAVSDYKLRMGRAPRGMWPAEGAVSAACVPLFVAQGIQWIASDQGVLERSGKWGYRASDPDVLCRAYRLGDEKRPLAIFFREHELSDMIGFALQHVSDPDYAAHRLLSAIRQRYIERFASDEPRVLTLILDGENPWGSYARAGQPFLEALYRLLEVDSEIECVTFCQHLAANPAAQSTELCELATGSWIDELGSRAGTDLGTWIGEQEENTGWELLADTRAALERAGATPLTNPAAFESLYIAEGSDWFWWFGADQDSGRDDEFESLFRARLRHVHRCIGQEPPAELYERFVAAVVPWSFSRKLERIVPGDRLVIRTNCPGILSHRFDDQPLVESELAAVGGVMAGPARHQIVLGPMPSSVRKLSFRFRCTSAACDRLQAACRGDEQHVAIEERRRARRQSSPARVRA